MYKFNCYFTTEDTEEQKAKYRREDKVHRVSAFLRGLCLL